jgi:hypothetical protein
VWIATPAGEAQIARVKSALLLLGLAGAALPAFAGHRSQTFRVAAVVVRSARVQATPDRLWLSQPAVVAIDSGQPRLVTGDLRLAPGTVTVTVHY